MRTKVFFLLVSLFAISSVLYRSESFAFLHSKPEELNIRWNGWKDANSVRKLLLQAQESGKSYFSQFHLYDVRSKNIQSSKYLIQTGEVPYIYALDFYYAAGTYFLEDYQQKNKKAIIEVVKNKWRENRSIPSFSWHLENPYVESSFGDYMGCRYRYGNKGKKYPVEHRYVIKEILTQKGGQQCGFGTYKGNNKIYRYDNPRKWFDAQCKEIAEIINQFVDNTGKPIPFIFRLWHECEDSWMWWGCSSVSANDYKKFFILTERNIKKYAPKAQILWAYCTDRNWKTKEDFMARYPGDKYVDIIGYDDYEIGCSSKKKETIKKARIVTQVAKEHGKVAGLFETANIQDESKDNFMSDFLYPLIETNGVSFGIVQMWTNGTFETDRQYNDRKKFLKFTNILMIKSNE